MALGSNPAYGDFFSATIALSLHWDCERECHIVYLWYFLSLEPMSFGAKGWGAELRVARSRRSSSFCSFWKVHAAGGYPLMRNDCVWKRTGVSVWTIRRGSANVSFSLGFLSVIIYLSVISPIDVLITRQLPYQSHLIETPASSFVELFPTFSSFHWSFTLLWTDFDAYSSCNLAYSSFPSRAFVYCPIFTRFSPKIT